MLSGEIARKYGSAGLPDDTITLHFKGSAGQSFGAFLSKGVTLQLEGESAKGESAGSTITGLRTALDEEKQISSEALAKVELLNQQLAALRRQIATLNGLLADAETRSKTDQAQIIDLGKRLNSALSPTHIELIDDSEQHRGHGGYNPAGESHFSLAIESPAFAGKSRVERQRMVYSAMGDLVRERVHALTIRASAPGEK